MNNNYKKELKKVIEDYIKEGYHVILNPKDIELPVDFRKYCPDAIAIRGEEKRIIQIKSSRSNVNTNQLKDLAVVAENKGWLIDLISIKSDENSTNLNLTSEQTRETILELKKQKENILNLLDLGFNNQAFILTWALLESSMRILVHKEKIEVSKDAPMFLIKTLFSYGLLDEADYKHLLSSFTLRNTIVHGHNFNAVMVSDVKNNLDILETILETSISSN